MTSAGAASAAPIDVLSIGEPMIEFNQARAPAGAPDDLAPCYLQGYGGDTSNMIVAAARSGASTAYVTRVGDDPFGRLFLDLWRAEGVDTSAVGIDAAAHTAVYFVTHDETGHAFSYLRAGSAASRLGAGDVPDGLLRRARIVHASGITQAISVSACDAVLDAFARARAAGARTAFDANLRVKLWPLARARAMIVATLAITDYFFPSVDELQLLSGLDDPAAMLDWCHGHGARHVLLKLGAGGVIASDGARRERIAPHRVEAIDATGAGDCFCGACLARLAAGDTLVPAARYANAAAALSTTGWGAVAPLPRREAVEALLAAG